MDDSRTIRAVSIAMIFFFENGRLGNQLFQYAAIRTAMPEEMLCFVGMQALNQVMDGVDAKFLCQRRTFAAHVIKSLAPLVMRYAAFGKVIDTLQESEDPFEFKIKRKRGVFPWVKYCRSGFFQNENYFNAVIMSKIKIRDSLVHHAKEQLEKISKKSQRKIFIHIRRGDHMAWPSAEHPAVLPAYWYRNAMDVMRKRYDNPLFLIFSDDCFYAQDMFGDNKDVWISQLTEDIDFAMMAQCEDGILSASTFAWWAAYFARKSSFSGLFLAPLYWGGHRQKNWYPTTMRTNWITYLPVLQSAIA